MITDIDACVFDAYGTLLDVASAVRHKADRIGDDWMGLANTWRTKQLEYTWLRSLMDEYVDFQQVTGDALDFAMETAQIDDAALRGKLMDLYDRLDAYPEVPDMLRSLRAGGFRTAILSNGTQRMIEAALDASGMSDLFDAVYTVEPLAIYKPDKRVYQLAVDGLGIEARRILFFSSNAWDVSGASNFGFRVVWVNRFGHVRERLPAGPERVESDLAGLPGLLGL